MIFLAVTLLISGLLHWALCRFALRLFAVAHPGAKMLLAALFALLSIAFMAAFLMLRWTENAWTINLYRAAAVWFALSVNLALAAAAAWLLYGAIRAAGGPPALFRPIGAAALIAALAASLAGFWNAFHPRVTAVEVALENLPPAWEGKRIAQLSDLHLGHFHGTAGLLRLAARLAEISPELVLITGDLFDGMSDGMEGFAEPLKRIEARRGVFFVSGNHEVYAGLRRSLAIAAAAGMRVLENEVAEVEGLRLLGVAYPGVADEREIRGIEKILSAPAPAPPVILLFHTPTDIRAARPRDRRAATYFHPDTDYSLNRRLGVALQLSGHTHRGQIFPFGLLTRWIYRGFDYGLHRDGGFALYVTSGVGTWGPPMRTAADPEIVVLTLRRAGSPAGATPTGGSSAGRP
jgi:predicted MPP superfamily phosphohydrolase